MIEYVRGNPAYEKYFRGTDLRTSILNRMELYYCVLSKEGEKAADRAFLAFRNYQVAITDLNVA